MRRGEIWWAYLPEPAGSEPGHRRPVLVIQADSFNRSQINTIIAVALTSNLRLADAPGNVRISARSSGLSKDSVVNVSQIATLDKSFMTEYVGEVSTRKMEQIEDGLRLVLSL